MLKWFSEWFSQSLLLVSFLSPHYFPEFSQFVFIFVFIFIYFIFRCALVGSMGYLVFYQSVLDPRGIHLYIILSPRYTDVKHATPLTRARNIPVLLCVILLGTLI